MTDHEWPHMLGIDASVGFHRPARSVKIFAPSPLAAAITGQLCCLSYEHGPGCKILLGPLWLRRANETAEDIDRQCEELD